MAVRIITDSGCDIVGTDNPQLDVLPLSITFGSTVYADGVDLSHEHFYELLVEGDELPKTGQVNPYAFAQAIERAEHDGFEPLIITLSAKLSGTYQSACMAASEGSLPVRVVDSGHVTVSERILVEYALSLAKKGLGVEEIATRVEAARERVVVIGLLDTLEYLRRGGRISAAAGAFGEMLSIKPVITIENGEVKMLGRARGSKNGRNLLNQQIEASRGIDFSMPVALGYAGLSDALLQKYIHDSRALWEAYPGDELPVHTVGATIGTHVGPGAIALAYFEPEQ